MSHRYLEVTFRNGRPIAAYLYLPRNPGDKSARTERRSHGLLVDFSADDRPIGIEITTPNHAPLAELNQLLGELHQAPATPDEFRPMIAA